MKNKLLYLLLLSVIVFTSCGEYNKILKSSDNELKYSYAKKYFDDKKYSKAIVILESILPSLKGTANAEEALFLLAQSHFYDKDYYSANQYYKAYTNTYPKGEYAELARFNGAYGLYLDSPDPRLDQTNTIKSMQEFQTFMEFYPKSDKISLVQDYLFQMQEKLAYKEFLACKLYYNLGNYMGNNYESCIITAREALKSYPYSKYAEEFQLLILKSKFDLAEKSIHEKQAERFREVVDEHFNYLNMFPEGKHLKEAEKYYRDVLKKLGESVDDATALEVQAEDAALQEDESALQQKN